MPESEYQLTVEGFMNASNSFQTKDKDTNREHLILLATTERNRSSEALDILLEKYLNAELGENQTDSDRTRVLMDLDRSLETDYYEIARNPNITTDNLDKEQAIHNIFKRIYEKVHLTTLMAGKMQRQQDKLASRRATLGQQQGKTQEKKRSSSRTM